MMGKILKFLASRYQQNASLRVKSCIKLLYTKTMFLKGALLTFLKALI